MSRLVSPASFADVTTSLYSSRVILRAILGYSASQVIDIKKSFFEIGLDSIGAVELKNRLQSGLGKKVIETYQYYHERLKEYKKIYQAIRITQPDMQGRCSSV